MKILNKKNSKGEIGETLTWIVATLIILVVMIFFIFGASLLGGTKKVEGFRESLTSGKTFEDNDIFLKKSLFTYVSSNSDTERLIIEDGLWELSLEGKFDLNYNETRREILIKYSKR